MKKIMNFRLFFLCALAVSLAIVFATNVCKSSLSKIITFFILLVVFACLVALSLIYKKKFLKVVAVLSLFMSLPFICLYSWSLKLERYGAYDDEKVVVSGRIYEMKLSNNKYARLTLDGVTITTANGEESIKDKLIITVNAYGFDMSQVELGRYVVASTSLKMYSLGNLETYVGGYLSKGIVGQGYCYYYNINFLDEYNVTLRDKIKTSTLAHLENMNIKHSEIGYAMMFGDTVPIEDNVVDIFRTTGVAHLLAVSGLHVSIIVMVICFLLKKLKVPNIARLIVVAILLGFYCYVCGFSISVVRASLMSIIMLYAGVRGKCYDRLSALSFVACLILSVSPLQLYNVSFVLSFTTVFAITILSTMFNRALSKVLSKKLAVTLSLNFAVQFIIFATSVYYFKSYPILGFFANLITVPVATFSFVYFLFMLIFTAILPFMSFAGIVYSWLMDFVVRFNYVIGSFNLTFSPEKSLGIIILFMLMLIFVISKHLFIKKKTKAVISSLIATSIVCFLVI